MTGQMKLVAALVILALFTAIGWKARGLQCAADLADFKQELADKAQAQRDETAAIEAKQAATTNQSTERLDAKQAEQRKEIVYVDKQVIQYRDRWRDRTCQRPADWVRLYNTSLFGTGGAVP